MAGRRTTFRLLVPAIVILAGAVVAVVIQRSSAISDNDILPEPNQDLRLEAPAMLHPIVIHRPDGPPGVETGMFDTDGQPITANCTTCHATHQPNFALNDGAQLIDFHQGLKTQHGDLTCLTCHNPDDYSALRKADGASLAFTEVIQMCAQCHGPQYRDYVNGSHGGMTGYWDLTRGPRHRNSCVVCHDPHAPQYPQVLPVFVPRDRFLAPVDTAHGAMKEEIHD